MPRQRRTARTGRRKTSRRLRRFRVDPGQADAILLHGLEQQVHQPDEEARDQEDDGDGEEPRHRTQNPRPRWVAVLKKNPRNDSPQGRV